ncbi:hypothetical protein MBLNU459_g3695t1 [Dothideomycetes sp. NU459]
MQPGSTLEAIELAKGHEPKLATPVHEKELQLGEKNFISEKSTDSADLSSLTDGDVADYEGKPTEEELNTLPRVSGALPWTTFTIAFVELCERFGYYGTTVVFVNFIQRPLPPGSTTGAGFSGQSGALGMGQRASTALTLFNQFWSYCMPLLGAYIADEHLGRYTTIMMAIGIAIVGHIIIIISATPHVITHPDGAIACFAIGMVVLGVGTGCFKSNISPLIAEQYTETKLKVTTDKKGNRVIMDPTLTVSRIFLYFYMMINIGSLVGQIGMVYAEKYVGFWLSFTLPTILYCLCPIVLYVCRNKYARTPPTGSVLAKALKLWGLAWKSSPSRASLKDGQFWERVKPSNVASKPVWMTFDDAWVDQVRRGLKACTVFLWYPLYWLAYNQMTGNLTSQAATMELNGVPNDVINNLNPISLIIFIPLMDMFVYPGLRKAGINFTPLKRICLGFMLAALAMIAACVTQYYIYKKGPCGHYMNTCDDPAPINVWVQTLPYVLIGVSEIFASITGLEYAFTKAPKNMRSLVMAVNLFMNAISAAISQAFVALSDDPLLVWNYAIVAILAFVGGCLFWLAHSKLDAEEDKLNMLPDSTYGGKGRRNSVV